ncbi:MAG: proline racemase family protein [Gemmatimonadetes bacterium]|nr:proline racemase family protein [Gemmatimonadota bacterium]
MRGRRVITVVDAHAGGEPGRVVTGGVRVPPAERVYDTMRWMEREADGLRRLLLREPRGYPALCANVLVPPCHPEADAGFVILEQTEYPPMSGSNTFCVATVLLETGMIEPTEPVTRFTLEAPAGLVRIEARVRAGQVQSIRFENVPAFAVHLDAEIDVPTLGRVRVDVAWGGMFHVLADAARLGLELVPERGADLARVGAMLTAAAREQLPAVHPTNPGIEGVSIAQLTGPPSGPHADGRNTVVVSTGTVDWDRPSTWRGALDRSPCGTGTCARMAVLHARGLLEVGQPFRHEGILGTVWTGSLGAPTRIGDRDAVVPALEGRAWITGFSHLVLDPEDPFPEGFTLGDLWS